MREFGNRLLLTVGVVALGACGSSSSTISQQTEQRTQRDSVVTAVAPAKRLRMLLNTGGTPQLQADRLELDTARTMMVSTVKTGRTGDWETIRGLALLEDVDYDSLLLIIERGDIMNILQADVRASCPQSELITLELAFTNSEKRLRLEFSDCARDYNLLLSRQRKGFAQLMNFFDRIRTKYRPGDPYAPLK